jgi:hypothetical protein
MRIRIVVTLMVTTMLSLASTACVEQPQRPPPPPPGERHPAYLRALSDLREARWLIAHRNGQGVANADEQFALEQINGAIAAIRQAAFDDGKDANYPPPPDIPPNGQGRLHKALNILRRVRADVAREEDNGFAQGLRNNAIQHVDAALGATESAIRDLQSIE